MKSLKITKLQAVEVDCGDAGHPGSQACQCVCELWAHRNGKWSAVGRYSTGCNQGYYQENYSYGPWQGKGGTPHEAAIDMVRRAGLDGRRTEMQRAAHDALAEIDADMTFAALATAEADRIESLVRAGEARDSSRMYIGGVAYFIESVDERMALRRRAVKQLRRLAGDDLVEITMTDDELLAEARRRGLID